jgi:hypothetical protein
VFINGEQVFLIQTIYRIFRIFDIVANPSYSLIYDTDIFNRQNHLYNNKYLFRDEMIRAMKIFKFIKSLSLNVERRSSNPKSLIKDLLNNLHKKYFFFVKIINI